MGMSGAKSGGPMQRPGGYVDPVRQFGGGGQYSPHPMGQGGGMMRPEPQQAVQPQAPQVQQQQAPAMGFQAQQTFQQSPLAPQMHQAQQNFAPPMQQQPQFAQQAVQQAPVQQFAPQVGPQMSQLNAVAPGKFGIDPRLVDPSNPRYGYGLVDPIRRF